MKKAEKAYDALLTLLLLVPVTLFSAYTTMTLWNWFIADTFSIIRLGMWQAYGVDIVVTYLTYKKAQKNNEEKDYATTIGMVEAAFVTGMFLLVGLVIKQFI